MNQVKFQVEGVDGDFVVDADEAATYKTVKAFAMSTKRPSEYYMALERMYMGKDEEYGERVGLENMNKLNNAAFEAVVGARQAKKSSDSSETSKSIATKS